MCFYEKTYTTVDVIPDKIYFFYSLSAKGLSLPEQGRQVYMNSKQS